MSDDLVPQIKYVHEILAKAKVEIFEVDGYEADDLIGTIATQAVGLRTTDYRKNRPTVDGSLKTVDEVLIVSGDRDLLQLVNHHVKMIAPITGLTNMLVFDEAAVTLKYGIKPSQMVDYKALVGDPSDNYPGVAGIGPKTASTLINEYKSLTGIYENLEKIKSKNPNLAMKLAKDTEAAGLAQKLAGVVLDAPITLDIEKAGIKYFDKQGLIEEFEKFGFKSLLNRLSAGQKAEEKKKEPKQMELL